MGRVSAPDDWRPELFDPPPPVVLPPPEPAAAPRVPAGPPQLTVPSAERRWPTMQVVAVHRFAGRLYRCRRCGALRWSSFGRARLHRRYCRRRDWPEGRP